jgi:hypothetical protein
MEYHPVVERLWIALTFPVESLELAQGRSWVRKVQIRRYSTRVSSLWNLGVRYTHVTDNFLESEGKRS